MNIYDNLNPMDFRYYGRSKGVFEKLQPYLSEEGMIQYMAKVEAALVNVLAKRKVCSPKIAKEVAAACKKVTADEVYKEEDRIKHNVKALANMIRKRCSDEAKSYVHFTATSHDIICTADAARLKDVAMDVVIPALKEFERTLIKLALREKNTVQIGRTHGQHAEPITFGYTITEYVARLGDRIKFLQAAANNLRGKMAGAVGAYNASSIFIKDVEKFEKQIMDELGIKPGDIATQVVQPEFMTDYVHALVSTFGVLANLADDMRHLQRSEINEVAEAFGKDQVGSSTMPHKRNPINFENVKGMWKVYMPRMMTQYSDQICEHQRDLTNSVTSRYVPEIVAGLVASTLRLNKVMGKLVVDKEAMQRNFDMNKAMVAAEPAYILLAAHGHDDGHEVVRKLTLEAQKTGRGFVELFFEDEELQPYIKKFSRSQVAILKDPEKYTGLCVKKTVDLCKKWKKELKF